MSSAVEGQLRYEQKKNEVKQQDSWQYTSEETDAVAAVEVVVSRVGSGGSMCAVRRECRGTHPMKR